MTASKVALVTGSGKRRIGAHVAEALAERGYSLVIHYRTSKAEADLAVERFQQRGVQAIAVQADLSEEKAVLGLVDAAVARFGRLDVLVNCAADWKSKRLEEVTAADVRHFFEVNTLGSFLCSVRAGLTMATQNEGGCIILVGDWATRRPYLHYAAYLASKGSLPTLTRTLAVELGSRNPGVRVNCILPGPVMLPPDLPAHEREEAIQGTLVRHEGHPDDVARAVVFLVESPFVTGVVLPVDGGRSIFAPEYSNQG
jgi:pteridine reductase